MVGRHFSDFRAAMASSTLSWMPKTFVSPVIRKILRMRSCVQTRSSESVVGADALEATDEYAQAGGVEELHLLHVHHELVVTVVNKVDEKLTQPRGGIDVDLALDVDDLDPVRRVMLQLQVHKSSRAMRSFLFGGTR